MDIKGSLIYLIWCSLNDEIPDEALLRETDFEQLFQICQKHKITALTDLSVHNLSHDVINDKIKEKFYHKYLNVQRINILFEAEKERIFEVFEKNKIWYLPLKGCIIKDVWPQSEIREHADIDILFDRTYADKVRTLMADMGYNTKEFGKSYHDTYIKKPIYNFEMHRYLFTNDNEKTTEYYMDINQKMFPAENQKYQYRLSCEDFYIYFIAHAVKHLRLGGTGLRTLVDIYLYLQNVPLNFSYISEQLSVLEISDEEEKLRNISNKLFSLENNGNLSLLEDDEKNLLNFIFLSGAYGTIESKAKLELSALSSNQTFSFKNKFIYWTKRIFAVPARYNMRYPKLYKNKVTRPLIHFVRFYNGLTKNRKYLISEFRTVRKMKK